MPMYNVYPIKRDFCTKPRVSDNPSQPRLTVVLKMTTVSLALHYWEIQ